MKFYLVTNINNLSDFFSTGLISPFNFYKERDFGKNSYEKSIYDLNDDYITLYKKPPISVDEADEKSGDKLILVEVNLKKDNLNLVQKTNGIYLYSSSVYLDINDIRLLVSDEIYSLIVKKVRIIKEIKIHNVRKSIKIYEKNNYTNYDIENMYFEDNNNMKSKFIIIDNYLDKIKGYYALNINFNKEIFYINENEKENYDFIGKCINFMKEIHNYKDLKNKKKTISMIKDIVNNNNKIKCLNLKSHNIVVKSNGIMEFENSNLKNEEKIIFNIINNLLLQYSVGKKGYYTNEELKNILIALKNKLRKVNEKYINDLEKIYLRIIENNIDVSVDMIENIIMKNLYVAILKYDNIEELNTMILKKGIEKSFVAVSFVGIILGYASLGRSISDKVYKEYMSLILEKQMLKVNEKMLQNNTFDIDIYRKLNQLRSDQNMYSFICKLKNITNVNLYIKNTGNSLIIIVNNNYVITFYRKIYNKKYKEFLKESKKINIRINNTNSKYKYFTFGKYGTSKMSKLNLQEKSEFLKILEYITK